MILDKINHPNDIHAIPIEEFPQLASEIREKLIYSVGKNGGHLASNLGTIELTLALHNVLDLPKDVIIWDVGHQAYTHKILTGRKDAFDNLRKEDGISGFPKRDESPCDFFDSGHSSNSISAGLGYVRARELLGQNHRVVSVIGDGALTGGMAYEALNNAAELKTNFIIVLNDNAMSISKNVGGISTYLSALRTAQVYTGMKLSVTRSLNKVPKIGPDIVNTVRKTKSSIKTLLIPGMFFEDMGLTYLGPVDGHNMRQMMRLFNEAKKVEGAVIVHVLTQKGRGYAPARKHPDRFHGTGPFDISTGKVLKKETSYTDVFSEIIMKLAKKEKRLVAITAAMRGGTGLKRFSEKYPDRFFDVGIAEEHAVTFAAGLALANMVPLVAIYSTFLQRAIDQMIQDVCLQNLHVIFVIDRAGIVGADGPTHHGCFDLTYLSMMPNMTVMAPADAKELEMMLEKALELTGPVAIRYPRAAIPDTDAGEDNHPLMEKGKARLLKKGEKVALITVGRLTEEGRKACHLLEKENIHITHIDARFVKPFDEELFDKIARTHQVIVTAEENVKNGGFGANLSTGMLSRYPNLCVYNIAIEDTFIPHGDTASLLDKNGLSAEKLAGTIRSIYTKTE